MSIFAVLLIDAGFAVAVVVLHRLLERGQIEGLSDLGDSVSLHGPTLLDGLLQMDLAVLGRHVVVTSRFARHPGRWLAEIRVDALVLHGLVVVVVHDDIGLTGAQQRLATHGQRELGDLPFADEALAHRVGVQAAKKPVAEMLVGVVVIFREGARRSLRYRAALVAEYREVAIPCATRIQHHVDARAIGQRAAQWEHRRVQLLQLHFFITAEAAGAHHHGRGHNIDALIRLNAGDHAFFHNNLLGLRAEKELAPIGLDVCHKGVSALLRIGQNHVAAAEAHTVGVGDEFHLDAEIEHRVDRFSRVSQTVAQKRAVYRATGEIVHVGEDLVEGHHGVLLLLKPRLTSRRTAAHGEVGNGG